MRTLERTPVTTHPRSALMVGPVDQTVYSKVSQKIGDLRVAEKSHRPDFFDESVAMLRLGIAAMRRPRRG